MNAINRDEIQAILATRRQAAALSADTLLDVVLGKRFGVEYRPVVDLQSGEIAGYQAGARFWDCAGDSLAAQPVFAMLHENPALLYRIQLEILKLQIAQAPQAGWLLLELDMQAFYAGGDQEDNAFLQLLKPYAWSDRELIVKIAASSDLPSAQRAQRMRELIQHDGSAIALDDIGAPHGMLALGAFLDARLIRLDGVALRAMHERAAHAMLSWIVSAARRIGVQIVMDSVANCEQLEWARRMGIDAVQGSLFNRQNILAR